VDKFLEQASQLIVALIYLFIVPLIVGAFLGVVIKTARMVGGI
jgi:hypothetical protein